MVAKGGSKSKYGKQPMDNINVWVPKEWKTYLEGMAGRKVGRTLSDEARDIIEKGIEEDKRNSGDN